MSIEYVTTQGLSTYERAVNSNDKTATHRQKPKTHKPIAAPTSSTAPVSVPLPLPSAAVRQPVAACTLKLSQIPPERISQYELMRNERGDIKYVQQSAEGAFYDVNYWNARLGKSIPLGRFTDQLTASLAHAIAREESSKLTFQVQPYAVQDFISRTLAAPSEQEEEQDQLSELLQPTSSNPDDDQLLDFDTLFAMTTDASS